MHAATTLGHGDAQLALTVMEREVVRHGGSAVLAVADSHGELIALLRMDGAKFASTTIAANKAYTAAREQVASKTIGLLARDPSAGFDIAYFGDGRFVGWGGGVPVVVDGTCVGAVAVSGLPEAVDIEIAAFAADALVASITAERTAASAVTTAI